MGAGRVIARAAATGVRARDALSRCFLRVDFLEVLVGPREGGKEGGNSQWRWAGDDVDRMVR